MKCAVVNLCANVRMSSTKALSQAQSQGVINHLLAVPNQGDHVYSIYGHDLLDCLVSYQIHMQARADMQISGCFYEGLMKIHLQGC